MRAHSESSEVKTLMGEAPLSDWVVMDGFLKEVIFELSLNNLIKRKIKGWWWEMVTVFHAEEGTCVQAQRFEAVTLLRKA